MNLKEKKIENIKFSVKKNKFKNLKKKKYISQNIRNKSFNLKSDIKSKYEKIKIKTKSNKIITIRVKKKVKKGHLINFNTKNFMNHLEFFFYTLLFKKQFFFFKLLNISIKNLKFDYFDYLKKYNIEKSKINPFTKWKLIEFHNNWYKPYNLLLIFYDKLIIILKNLYKLRFFIKYWHFVTLIPKNNLGKFYNDKDNNIIKTLLFRASYFPKSSELKINKALKFKKLDFFIIKNLIKRFERLWLQNIYPCIYKWLFLKKYKYYWRNLFLKFINLKFVSANKSKFLIATKFRRSFISTKKKNFDDKFMVDFLSKKKKKLFSRIDSTFHRLFSGLVSKK